MNIDFTIGKRYEMGGEYLIDEIQKIVDRDVLFFTISHRDFKEIFKIDYKEHFELWFDNYFTKSKGLLELDYVEYSYDASYNFKSDADENKRYLYDITKYHYFITNNITEYRVPLGILKDDEKFTIHPGNARLNCMFHWSDNAEIKIIITDYSSECITKLKKTSKEYLSLYKDKNKICSYLNLADWKNIFLRFTPDHGLELGEQHDALKEFSQEYKIQYYKNNCIIINDFKIMYKEDNCWRLSSPL